MIRPATPDDLPLLPAIELDAGTAFTEIGYAVGEDTHTEADQRRALEDGVILVAEDDGVLVGFALVWRLDGAAHLLELDVLRSAQGRGVGRALVQGVCDWARADGLCEVTLTTYSEVPWNRPWYERLGFAVFKPGPERSGLQVLLENETQLGLNAHPRVAMRRGLSQ